MQNSINLTEDRKNELERLLISIQKERSETDQYGETLINIIGLEKTRREGAAEDVKINRRTAETFKDLVAEAEARTDALLEQAKIDKAINEANKDFQANSAREVILNKQIIDANNDLIDILREKKAAKEAEILTKDASTKLGS